MAIASTLSEAAFTTKRKRDWDRLDALVRTAQARGVSKLEATRIGELSPLYLDVSADLSRATAAPYGAPLVAYLQALTAAAHSVLYGRRVRAGPWTSLPGRALRLRVALEVFPRAVRRHRSAVLVAFLLFFVPFFAGLFAELYNPGFAVRIVPESQLRPLAEAYRQGFASGRAAGMDATMAGFYVNNNVGIALRCFATGLFAGLGSAVYLVENGISTGALMGYVVTHGGGPNILTFVVGHGSLELGAIVLSGGAGLALGWSLVAPGDKTRVESMQAAGRSVVPIVFGAATMLLLAAAIEGFWSASSVPSIVKRVVGAAMLAVVLTYVLVAGRRSKEAELFDGSEADPWT
ncbi:MAG TPA: stage II sporulation protein M [Polyangiaceae bacterium]|nr:stage II sporulation protein M [Polyangiaceae bacterium]